MFSTAVRGIHSVVSAIVAVTIVSFGALALDQGHIAAAPRGIVEVGELSLVDVAQMPSVTLPEVVVSARHAKPGNPVAVVATQPKSSET